MSETAGASARIGAEYLARADAERVLRQHVPRAVAWAALGGFVASLDLVLALPMPWGLLVFMAGVAGVVPGGRMLSRWSRTASSLRRQDLLRVEIPAWAALIAVQSTAWLLSVLTLGLLVHGSR